MYAKLLLYLSAIYTSQSSNPLDIADYTFYLNTRHYDLKNTVEDITLEPNIHLNINLQDLTIGITSDLHHKSLLSLDIVNDNDWNEISLISSVDNHTKIQYEQYIAIDKPLSWNDAQSYCKHHFFGHLASIHTTTDNTVLTDLCHMLPNSNNNDCWIGLKYPFSVWQDNKPATFTSFNEQYVNDDSTSCTAMYMDNNDALWSKVSCNIPQPFICQRSQILYRSRYVGVVSRMDYVDAQTYCIHKFGTKIADYNDKYREDILRACKDTANGDWCWMNDNKCIKVKDNDIIRNTECYEAHFFLCERYMDPDTIRSNEDDRRRLIDYWSEYYGLPPQQQQEQGQYDEEGEEPMQYEEEQGQEPAQGQGQEEYYEEEEEPASQEQQQQQQPQTPIHHPHPMVHHPLMHHPLHPMHPMHPMNNMMHPMHHMMHPMHRMGMMHPMHHMMHPMHQMGMMGHPMMGGMGMNPMMGGMMGGMNPMMGGMGGMMGGMGMNPMMGGVHHVYDIHAGNTQQWRKKMRDMLRMMKDMDILHSGQGRMGCHQHYGCGHNHGMQHCVFFGTQLICNMGYPVMPYNPWSMIMTGQSPMGMYGMPPMGGLYPMGNTMHHNQQNKKPIVVVHSKNGNTVVKHRMVNDDTANQIKQNGVPAAVHHRRRMVLDEESVDMQYVYDEVYMDAIIRCRVLEVMDTVKTYDICVKYDINEMVFSLDIKNVIKKVRRRNNNKSFRFEDDIEYNRDYDVGDVFGDNYVSFEPIKGNLGFVVYKYELMDEATYDDMHQFDYFDEFVHYFHEFEFVYDVFDHCSARLDGLPFKLCLNVLDDDILLYFERDDAFVSNNDINPDYSLMMQQYIDGELQDSLFNFNDDNIWNEMNRVNNGIEKCLYLSTSKLCIKKEDSDTIKASIKSQLAHKTKLT